MYVSCECAGPAGRSARTFNQSMLFSIDLVALSQLEKQTVPRGGGPGDVAARCTSPHCTECLFCWRSRWNWKEEPSLWTVAAGTVWKSLSTTFLLWLVNLWTPDAYEHLQINPESKEFFFHLLHYRNSVFSNELRHPCVSFLLRSRQTQILTPPYLGGYLTPRSRKTGLKRCSCLLQ